MSCNKSKLALAVGVALGLASTGAFATNGIVQAGNGMVAHGFGGAGLSNAGEAAAGMDNPALISQTGDSLAVGWTIFMPDRTVDSTGAFGPVGTVATSDSKMFAIPQIAFTSKSSDKLSWGVMAYALGGMNTDYRTGVQAGSNPESVNLQGMIVAPTVSYAINKDVSAGLSLLVGYETLTTRNLFGQGSVGTNEGSATGYGVKLGIDAKLGNGLSVGAMLQPKMSMDEISYFRDFLVNVSGFSGDAALTLPNEIGVGAKYALASNMDVVADILYYQWTSVDVFDFFGWDDQVVYKAGIEYRPSDKWALRAGLNYAASPIQGGNQTGNGSDAAFSNYPFPAISETHVTVGFGYKMDKNLTINGYYLYSPENTETATTTSNGGAVPPGTKISMTQNAFGIGINYSVK